MVANLGEDQVKDAAAVLARTGPREYAARPGFALCPVSAPIEAEMAQLPPEDAKAFRDDLGLEEPGLDRVIRTSYSSARPGLLPHRGRRRVPRLDHPPGDEGPDRRRGRSTPTSSAASSAPRSSTYDDLMAAGSIAACRDKGTLRLEGKDYEVRTAT